MTAMRNLQPELGNYGSDVARALEGYAKVYSGDRLDKAANELQSFVDKQAIRNATQGDYSGYKNMSPDVAKELLNMGRQATADEMKQQLFDWGKADRKKATEQEEAYGSLLTKLASIPTKTSGTKSVVTNQEDIDKAKANLTNYTKSQELGDAAIELQDDRILEALDAENNALMNVKEKVTPGKLADNVLRKTTIGVNGTEDPQGRYTGYVDNIGKEVPGWKRVTGNYQILPDNVIFPERSKYYVPGSTEITGGDAAREASSKVQLLEAAQEETMNKLKSETMPAVPKAIEEAITTEEPVSRVDYSKMLSNAILASEGVSAKDKMSLLGKVSTFADSKFGPAPKEATFGQQFDVMKYKKGLVDDTQKDKQDMAIARQYAKSVGVDIPKNLSSGEAALNYVKGTKEYKQWDDKSTKGTRYGAGPKTLAAYDVGVGTIDTDDQKKLEAAAQEYYVTDADLASIITAMNDRDILPRASGALTSDVLDYIKSNYKKR